MKCYKIYINLNALSCEEFNTFWDYVFSITDSFSLRFPNINGDNFDASKIYSFSNKIAPDSLFGYNKKLNCFIMNCNNSIIKKSYTNRYIYDKYQEPSLVLLCRTTASLKKEIRLNPNLFNWLAPDFPEDLSFFNKGNVVLYICSHEEIGCLYINEKQMEELNRTNKDLLENSFKKRISESEIFKWT